MLHILSFCRQRLDWRPCGRAFNPIWLAYLRHGPRAQTQIVVSRDIIPVILVAVNATVEPQLGTPHSDAEQPCASGTSHTSQDRGLRLRTSKVNGKVKDYTRTKNEACKRTRSVHCDDSTFFSDKSLTDMLLSSTSNITVSGDELGNTPRKMIMSFWCFEFPQPMDLSGPEPRSPDCKWTPVCNCDRAPIVLTRTDPRPAVRPVEGPN